MNSSPHGWRTLIAYAVRLKEGADTSVETVALCARPYSYPRLAQYLGMTYAIGRPHRCPAIVPPHGPAFRQLDQRDRPGYCRSPLSLHAQNSRRTGPNRHGIETSL